MAQLQTYERRKNNGGGVGRGGLSLLDYCSLVSRVARIFVVRHTKTGKYTEMTANIYQRAIKYTYEMAEK
jgi:hypothetical protein